MRQVRLLFVDAEILDHGSHWHSCVGGAASGSANDSFFWIEFRLAPVAPQETAKLTADGKSGVEIHRHAIAGFM